MKSCESTDRDNVLLRCWHSRFRSWRLGIYSNTHIVIRLKKFSYKASGSSQYFHLRSFAHLLNGPYYKTPSTGDIVGCARKRDTHSRGCGWCKNPEIEWKYESSHNAGWRHTAGCGQGWLDNIQPYLNLMRRGCLEYGPCNSTGIRGCLLRWPHSAAALPTLKYGTAAPTWTASSSSRGLRTLCAHTGSCS